MRCGVGVRVARPGIRSVGADGVLVVARRHVQEVLSTTRDLRALGAEIEERLCAMSVTELSLPARDAHPLVATLYEPASPNGISVLISSATAVQRSHYARFSEFLRGHGFVVLCYDFRGVGGSVALPAFRAPSYRAWAEEDMAGAIEWLSSRFEHNALVSVGHSAGGSIFGLVPNKSRVAAQLCVASSASYWRNWGPGNTVNLVRVWLASHVLFPTLTRILGHYPGWLFGGARWPRDVALEWARWSRHPGFFVGEDGKSMRDAFRQFDGPIRFYAFSDDRVFAPPRAAAHLVQFYEYAQTELLCRRPEDFGVPAIGHFGFFRSSMPQAAWREVAEWLRDRAVRS